MCLICRGLKKGKLSLEEAREKYEDMLDLIDEDHQEVIEDLLAEYEEEQNYWINAKREYYRRDNDDYDEEDALDEALIDDEYEDDN